MPEVRPLQRPPTERSAATSNTSDGLYVTTMLASSAVKNVLDVVRTVVKFPEAARAGRLPAAIGMAVTAMPTSQLIDPLAPAVATIASGGKSFTALDALLYRAGSFVGVGAAAFTAVSAARSVVAAVKAGGATALYDSRQGRDGVLQAAGAGLTLGTFGRAAVAARAAGVTGPGAIALAAATSPAFASPAMMGAGLASGVLIFANGRGFLDFMNRGEQRGVAEVARDSWSELKLPEKVRAARRRLGLD